MHRKTLRHSALLGCLLAAAGAQADTPPDLAVTDLTLDAECRAVATVQNLGPGTLPAYAYDQLQGAGYTFYKGPAPGAAIGGARLATGDAARALVNPGATVQIRALNIITGTDDVRFVVDEGNVISEASETNNTLTRTLACTIGQPDIAITGLTFNEACQPVLTVANAGQGALPANAYSSNNPYLQRWIDGKPGNQLYLNNADPQKALFTAGGQVTVNDTLPFAATQSLKYKLVSLPSAGNNTANDVREIALPERCGGPGETPADTGTESTPASTTTTTTPPVKTVPLKAAPTLKDRPVIKKRLPEH